MSDAKAPVRARKRDALRFMFPERGLFGFARTESRFLFFSYVSALLRPDDVVLDYGAGRGQQIEGAKGYLKTLVDVRSRCARLIGADVDPVVTQNPYVHEAHLIGADGRLPLPDASVDLIYAYAVLEHIENPAQAAAEIARVLKPGGWFCAWTPNRWGYVGMAVRMVPNRMHARLLKSADPTSHRQAHDVFDTAYRLNTRGAVRRAFGDGFEHHSFTANGTPSYHFGRPWLVRAIASVGGVLPAPLRQSLFVFERKKPA